MIKMGVYFLFWGSLLLLLNPANAQQELPAVIDPKPFADNANHWYGIADKKNMINALPDRPRYQPSEVKSIADNILLFQKSNGGWPKNYDMFAILTAEQQQQVAQHKDDLHTTFDNGTTYTQIRALAIAYGVTKDDRYKTAALQGLEYILRAQYANGGWPQYYPIANNYSRYITFNDGGMMGIVNLLKDITDRHRLYGFVQPPLLERLHQAYQKSIECLLNSQIKDGGKLTAWCQQHDDQTLAPVWARSFEPPSICNGESAAVVLFLMKLKDPDARTVAAVKAAVQWFEDSKIYHTLVKVVRADSMDTPYRRSTTDRIVVRDTTAPPIWTRYYELGTHRPMFCNRDRKIVYSLAEVERERRDGYAWYIYAPQKVLKAYPKWLSQLKQRTVTQPPKKII